MPDSTEVTICPMQQECSRANEIRWQKQDQRNAAADELHRRWGFELDGIRVAISDCKLQIAEARDHTTSLRDDMKETAAENKLALDGVTAVLQELAITVRGTREHMEQNHLALLSAMANNQSVAGRAVDQAHAAAVQADEAQQAAAMSTGKLSTMAKAVLTAWGLTIVAVSSTVSVLVAHYGWPALLSVFDRIFGAPSP